MFVKNGVISVFDLDNSRLSRFSEEGRHIEDVSLRAVSDILSPQAEDPGYIYAERDSGPGGNDADELVKFDKKTAKVSLISTVKHGFSFPKIDPMSDRFILRGRNDGKLIWAYTRTYELFLETAAGQRITRIAHSCARIKITDKDKTDYVKSNWKEKPAFLELVWPEYYSPIEYIILDDKDRLFVGTVEKDGEGRRKIDVFDAAGKYMGSFHFEDRIMVIRNGLLYAIAEDADGFPIVERYVMTWGK